MTRRLYGDVPGCRNYGDIDLLVAPRHFDASGLVLASLGFEDQLAGIPAGRLPGWRSARGIATAPRLSRWTCTGASTTLPIGPAGGTC